MSVAPSPWRQWLDAELERIWLCAEGELRRLQSLRLRPPPDAPSMAEVEVALAQRSGKSTPRTLDELNAALDPLMGTLASLRPSALERLTLRLGLNLTDVEALLLVAAATIDPQLADLFVAVRGSAMSRRGVDAALVGQLASFGRDERVATLELLDERRPPIAYHLIRVAPAQDVYSSASHRSIQPTLDLLWLLTSEGDTVSPSLRDHAELRRAQTSWGELCFDAPTRARLDVLAARFGSADGGALPWVVLWGAAGSGKREVASRLAALAGRALLAVNPRGVDKAGMRDLLRSARRDAAWLGAALYVGPLAEDGLHEQPALMSELERATGPVLLGYEATQPPRLRTTHPIGECALSVPEMPTRLALWQRGLAGAALADGTDVAAIARGYKLTPGEIRESAREARALAGAARLDGTMLRGVLERRLRNELGAVATLLSLTTSWDDVVLPVDAVERVKELIARKRYEDQVYRGWRLDERIGYGKGVVALFSGPPGTGKTLLAGLIAKELGFELYQVDLSQIFSRWIGETEKALARVFDQAERAHAVLLFDEADALFAKRTEVEDSRDRYANVAVNFLLQRLERYSGVAVLTTNKDAYLDEALKRRLSLHLQLEEPEAPERLRLWQKHLPLGVPGAETVDLAALAADYKLTGGYIKNVALRASFLSAAEDVPLSTEQVRRAAILELEDMGHVVFRPDAFADEDAPAASLGLAADYVEG